MHNTLGKKEKQFTLLIPAAGKGSRLGFHLPKILFPLKSKTPLEILLALFKPYIRRTILVVSPEGKESIHKKLIEMNASPFPELYIQEKPIGMVDAILKGVFDLGEEENVIIVWGDQVLLSKITIEAGIDQYLAHSTEQCFAVLPTTKITNPYIHFIRNEKGAIQNCLYQREKDEMPNIGESDTGFFLLKGSLLKKELKEFYQLKDRKGKITQEISFPSFFPYLSEKKIPIFHSPVENSIEALGLNQNTDLKVIEKYI